MQLRAQLTRAKRIASQEAISGQDQSSHALWCTSQNGAATPQEDNHQYQIAIISCSFEICKLRTSPQRQDKVCLSSYRFRCVKLELRTSPQRQDKVRLSSYRFRCAKLKWGSSPQRQDKVRLSSYRFRCVKLDLSTSPQRQDKVRLSSYRFRCTKVW